MRHKFKMKRTTKIIIVIIILILVLLLFVKLTGHIIRSTGTSVNSCSDSDGGKEYWKKGNVFGDYTFLMTGSYLYGDECVDGELLEYYCVDGFKESIKFECPEGCEDGMCLGEEIEVPEKVSVLNIVKRFFGF